MPHRGDGKVVPGEGGVGRKLTPDELEKAARNLEKIEAYLAPRTRWTADRAGVEAMASLQRSVGRLAIRMGSWSAAPASAPADGGAGHHEALEVDSLDSSQLAGFATFLERLTRWFETSDAAPPDAAGTPSVERLVRSLYGVRRALDELTGSAPKSSAAAPTVAPTTAVAAERGAGPSPVVDDVFAGAPRRERREPPAPTEQIAFTGTDPEPMFRWVGPEEIELTERARGRIERLFAEQGITFFRYQLENFIEEVRRRVKSAPEGHVLVIKVRDIGGERKPFLSYVSANTLDAG